MDGKGLQAACLAIPLVLASCACGDQPQLPFTPRSSPGVPITGALSLSPGSLPAGATASLPAFNGDVFSAVLPVHAQEDLTPTQALQEIEPVLRAVGFQRSIAELRVPDEPVHLPPADLEPLAEEVCREAALQQDRIAQEVCPALRGDHPPSAAAEAALQAAYGISHAKLRDDLERPVLQYPFAQTVGGVPIDGAGVFASRRSGESLSTLHGTLFNEYEVVNEPAQDSKAVLEVARRMLANRLKEMHLSETAWKDPVLVLLAYGSEQTTRGGEVPALRHAWRALLESPGGRSWLVWIDAETAEVLKLTPQWDHARGERWRRDPGFPTEVVDFEIDPASGGWFVLSLAQVFRRVDRFGDEIYDDDDEVAVPAGPVADFNVFPINNEAGAICRRGNNPAYLQVHAYSHLYSLWRTITSAGSIPAFPQKPIRVQVDVPDDGDGNAAFYDQSILQFVDGDGFRDWYCPNRKGERLNGVHDATILAHEMAHLSVKRLQDRRPQNWCGVANCQLPDGCGRALFHDFADAIGLAYASTSCFSGWTDKNMNGTNANLYCQGPTSEAGGFPRRIELPRDRFPDHHSLGTGAYADGQIAAAALWTVRQGMRSKDVASGTALFWARLQRALWSYAFVQPTCITNRTWTTTAYVQSCQTCDRDRYRYLQDLERRMLEQWAAVGAVDGHTANKVLAGWAAAGIFLMPYQCLDGDNATKDPIVCPSGEGGGDAVIDVDDADTTDDLEEDGVKHPEVDYLKRGALSPPRFRVWTGPRLGFSTTGAASNISAPLCNARYRVEVSADAGFTSVESAEGVASNCYAEVDFPNWGTLQATSGIQTIYYRVRTWDASDANERTSTRPGAGAYNVPPPFVIVNDSGRP